MELERFVRLMEERDVAKSSDLVGVSEREISLMETRLKVVFPAAYRQYLLRFGRSAGFLSTWMAIYFDDLEEIRDAFDALNSEYINAIVLPQNALLISNLDSVFDYIFCGDTADPEVFRIDMRGEDGAYCEKYAESFSAYIERLILNADADKLHGDAELDFMPCRDDDILAS